MIDHISLDDLSARIDDALPAPRRDQVDAHLASCTRCREAYGALSWTVELMRSLPVTGLPAGLTLHVPEPAGDAADAAPETTGPGAAWRFPRRRSVTALALAASVVVAVGLVAAALGPYGPWQAPARPEQSAALEPAGAQAGADAAAPMVPESSAALSVDEARSIGPTTDPRSAGYPSPLGTARAEAERVVGGVAPPSEVGLIEPARPITDSATALAAGVRQRGPAAIADLATTDEAVTEVPQFAPGAPAGADGRGADDPARAPADRPAVTGPASGGEAAGSGAAPWGLVGALAVVVGTLGALLWSRSRRRSRRAVRSEL